MLVMAVVAVARDAASASRIRRKLLNSRFHNYFTLSQTITASNSGR